MNNNTKKEKLYMQNQNADSYNPVTQYENIGSDKIKNLAYQAAADSQKLKTNTVPGTVSTVKQAAITNPGKYEKLAAVMPVSVPAVDTGKTGVNNGIKIYDSFKELTPSIAREIMRRNAGYDANPDIDLSEYGVSENTDPQAVLDEAAKLGEVGKSGQSSVQPTMQQQYDSATNEIINSILSGGSDYYDQAESMQRPEFSSRYQEQIDDMTGKIMDYGEYQADPRVNEALDRILNGEDFSYDINKDSLYANYKDQYERAARLAAEDALGRASAATGGYGSSYASAASQQSYNQQMQGLSDKIPQLYQLAYDRYQDQKQDAYDQYGLLAEADDTAYSRFENGRNNLYNQQSMLQSLDNTDYNRYRDDSADFESDRSFLVGQGDREVGNLETAAGLIGNQSDRITDRERYDDEKARYEEEKQFNDAAAAAELGDFSLMSDYLGVDLKDAETWDKVQKGMSLFSATGMLDYLKAAGLDTTRLEAQMADEQFNTKLAAAVSIYEATGDSAALKNLGIDTSYMDQIMQYTLAKAAKEANSSSGGSGGSGYYYNSSANTQVKELTQSTYDDALENFVNDTNGFNDYCNNLLKQGYTEDQVIEIANYVHSKVFTEGFYDNVLGGVLGSTSKFLGNVDNFFSELYK